MIELTKNCIKSIEHYFNRTNGKVAVIGISGGKDSTVAAALCVQALGKENVLGVLMPNGEQCDIRDSYKICNFLDIEYLEINIHKACYDIESAIDYLVRVKKPSMTTKFNQVSKQAEINLQPRIRMATLYAVAQSIEGGRVINTSNKCEAYVGWGTLWGDTVGDFSPLGTLLVSEIVKIGDDLGLPEELVHKVPSDGLTGKSDEENLGVTYDSIEKVILNDIANAPYQYYRKIDDMHTKSAFKREMINLPKF